ncbi:MAG: tetratricopeptide repeat protein [Pseudomonadota bacterium]
MNINSLERMLERGRDDALLRYGLGQAYLNAGEAARAAEHLKAAVAHKPDYSAAWKLLGKAYAEVEDLDAAMTAFDTGMANAEKAGDLQAVKEMRVFRRRAERAKAKRDEQA